MILLNPDENLEAQQEPTVDEGYHRTIEDDPQHQVFPDDEVRRIEAQNLAEDDGRFAKNGIAENNQYGSILPKTLFEQQPEDPVDVMLRGFMDDEDEDQVDFSISASTLRNSKGLLSRSLRQKIMKESKKEDGDGSGE